MEEYGIEEQVQTHKLNDKEKEYIIKRKNKLHRSCEKRKEKRREIFKSKFNLKRSKKKKG